MTPHTHEPRDLGPEDLEPNVDELDKKRQQIRFKIRYRKGYPNASAPKGKGFIQQGPVDTGVIKPRKSMTTLNAVRPIYVARTGGELISGAKVFLKDKHGKMIPVQYFGVSGTYDRMPIFQWRTKDGTMHQSYSVIFYEKQQAIAGTEKRVKQHKWVITDPHGHLTTFRALLKKIEYQRGDRIYLLGDLINKGPQSRELVDLVMKIKNQGHDIRAVIGNNERKVLDALTDPAKAEEFDKKYPETLRSFGITSIVDIAPRYVKFFRSLPEKIETPKHVLTHGDQPGHEVEGKRLIQGHSPTTVKAVRNALNLDSDRLLLDGGVGHGRNLLAYNISTGQLIKQRLLDQQESAVVNEEDYLVKNEGPNKWRVTKKQDPSIHYQVTVGKTGKLKCNCKGYEFRQQCRHQGLIPRDQIRPVSEAPQKPLAKRHPRAEVEKLVPKLRRILAPFGPWELAGSYRRQKDTLKDLDVLLVCEAPDFLRLAKRLERITDYQPTLGGKELLRGIYKGIPLDIQRVNQKEYPTYLLYRTGSQEFNIKMRTKAKRMGMKLNEHGLYDHAGKRLPIRSEKGIFKALDMEYVEPSKRD